MRIPLVGPAAAQSPLAVSASEATNVYAEVIETPEDQQKNRAILRKRPGVHLGINLGIGAVRGFFTGGGRVFAIYQDSLYEFEQSTYTPGTPSTGSFAVKAGYPKLLPTTGIPNNLPAIMFGNGNQLGIIANGQFFYDNGAGPIAARFLLEGTATAVGTTLTWQAGNQFTSAMVGRLIKLNDEWRTVSGYTSATQVTLSSAPTGSASGTVTLWYNQVFWTSGDKFTEGMVGKTITISGTSYTVKTFFADTALELIQNSEGVTVGAGYSVSLSNIRWECDGGDIVSATTGAYMAGSAWVQRPSGGSPDLGRQVNFSDPFDFSRWRGLSFKQKEAAPDYIQAIYADRGLLYIFGTESSEVWQLATGTGLPERIQGTEMREGLVCRYAPTGMAQSLFFLGGNPQGAIIAYRMRGFSPVRISTAPVEKEWASAGVFAGLTTAYAFKNSTGHQFWIVNFVNPAMSWAYDITASEELGYPVWHRLTVWDGAAEQLYPYWFHVYVPQWGNGGMHIVGGPFNGKIYEQSDLYGDDAGTDIRIRRAIPIRYNGGRRMFFGRQDLQAVGGSFTREYSDDNGATWSTPQAEMGNGSTRRFWAAGGSCNSPGRIWRYTSTGQDVVTMIDLQAEESPGAV